MKTPFEIVGEQFEVIRKGIKAPVTLDEMIEDHKCDMCDHYPCTCDSDTMEYMEQLDREKHTN